MLSLFVAAGIHLLTFGASEQTAFRRSGRAILAAHNIFIKTRAAGLTKTEAPYLDAFVSFSARRKATQIPLQHKAPQ